MLYDNCVSTCSLEIKDEKKNIFLLSIQRLSSDLVFYHLKKMKKLDEQVQRDIIKTCRLKTEINLKDSGLHLSTSFW